MKNKLIYLFVLIFSLAGCESYLDLVPENDIETIESVFEKKEGALQFLRGCYLGYKYIGSNTTDPAMCGADELMSTEYKRNKSYSYGTVINSYQIASGLQNPSEPILPLWDSRNNLYPCIRSCNVVIDNVDKVYNMTQTEKDQYKAEAKAIKAMYYFELLRMYGPIILVPQNISVEADVTEMQSPRQHVDTCFNRIVQLLDEAIPFMKSFKEQSAIEYGQLNKEAAYVLKAKVLLYQASPLFNGNEWYANFKNIEGQPLFSSEYDKSKWEKAAKAVDEAVEYCNTQSKSLENSYSLESTEKLNTMRNIQNSVFSNDWKSPELIYGIYSYGITDLRDKIFRYNPNHRSFNDGNKGCINPTMRMVEMYYTENGLPLEEDQTWSYSDRYKMGIEKDVKYKNIVAINKPVLNLHLKREPRFYANIAADKCIWYLNDNYIELDILKDHDQGTTYEYYEPQQVINMTGYYCKKFIDKSIDPTNANQGSGFMIAPFPKFRMAELYLMQAEAWNEVGIENKGKVYAALNKIRSRAGIPDIEDSWNNFSIHPEKITNKEGLREIIRQEISIEFAFEGHRFWDLRRWKIAHEYMTEPMRGWNVFGDENTSFYNNYEGPKIIWSENKFQSPRDYFWPIRDEEILKAHIVQNLGW